MVARSGIEPPREPSIYHQSVCITRIGEDCGGLSDCEELSGGYLQEMVGMLWYCWWPEVELNHRHTDFQSVALPTELRYLH